MPTNNENGYQPEKLKGQDTYCTTLSDLAGKFNFSNPDNFRRSVLLAGRYPWERVSRKRIRMRKSDIPGF